MRAYRPRDIGEAAAPSVPAAFSHVGPAGPCLQPGATTIMLRSLPKDITMDRLRQVLDDITPGRYDFLYLPASSKKTCSISVAIVNFLDHAAAKLAYGVFSRMGRDAGKNPSATVRQARMQGLAPNLAYFVATNGIQAAMYHPHAPCVIQDGVRANIMDVITRHVDMRLLAEAASYEKPQQSLVADVQIRQPKNSSSRSSQHGSVRSAYSGRFEMAESVYCPSSHGYVTDNRRSEHLAAASSSSRPTGCQSYRQGLRNCHQSQLTSFNMADGRNYAQMNRGRPFTVSGMTVSGSWSDSMIESDVSQSRCERVSLYL
eukprot:TRINITY_DN11008_c1_g4_i5.p1 TRINITY_DN11008_c1_g4~~TRINITY_DN11008_c1_g4_i5.p1  ORF type:complete len:316 (+),score=26.23 TRINITY_DN11008_c1_g4_i5:30-977(+)